MKLFVAR